MMTALHPGARSKLRYVRHRHPFAAAVPITNLRSLPVQPLCRFASGNVGVDTGEKGVSGDNQTKTKLFPWRHSSAPLARLLDRDDRSGLPNNARARFVRKTLAAREIDVPWFQILVSKSWQSQLAGDFTWAFQRGLSALLSKSFLVPMDDIYSDEDGVISLDTTCQKGSSSFRMSEDDEERIDEFVVAMLEESLVKRYGDIDPTMHQIKFSLQPIAWRFEHAFLVPMFTRDHVKRNPGLKGAYQKIEEEFVKSGSVSKVRAMGEQLAKDSGFSGMRTIIAEASIDCKEFFQIRDETGKVLQGQEDGNFDEEEVTHLVRFEMVTTKGSKRGHREPGRWQIIDWDDLLEGNVWH